MDAHDNQKRVMEYEWRGGKRVRERRGLKKIERRKSTLISSTGAQPATHNVTSKDAVELRDSG